MMGKLQLQLQALIYRIRVGTPDELTSVKNLPGAQCIRSAAAGAPGVLLELLLIFAVITNF